MARIREISRRKGSSSDAINPLAACRIIVVIAIPLLVVISWLESLNSGFSSLSSSSDATTVASNSGGAYKFTLPPKITDAFSARKYMDSQIGFNSTQQPLIYFITPTFKRLTQMADLTRLSNTLALAKGIYWIVIEDADMCSQRVRDLLDRSGLPYAHVAEKSLPVNLLKDKLTIAKGVKQRNRALDVTDSVGITGVVYFGDDDNAYDVRLFPGLRKTTGVGVFGVGYAGGGTYERCVVNKATGKVSSFLSMWESNRAYPVDMGALAFHTSVLRKQPKPRFSDEWERGYLETNFVELIVDSKAELQPLMSNCTDIYVWHVKTVYPYEGDPISLEDRDPQFKKILPTV